MGVEYVLINETKKEMISFSHLNGNKKRELAGNFAQSSIVTWYLLQNQGDQIQFVSDTSDDWPFESGSRDVCFSYPDRTEQILKQLIEQEILKDLGYLYRDEDDPENVYVKNIINVWAK
ncbi:hypothetical protein TDB9533_04820 [Thalassocella blandensis]|nr:hypothetical protein TDB9533_04820 [Thalassocella blandensis]